MRASAVEIRFHTVENLSRKKFNSLYLTENQ